MTSPSQPAHGQPPAATEPGAVEPPKHAMHALTTFELRGYRRQLESAIAFFDKTDPVPPAREDLQAKLDEVLTEQEDRARLATR